MLSFRTQNRLAQLIAAIAEGEKKTEVVRQVLAEQKSFEPHTAFKRIDTARDGYISSAELIDFLTYNNVAATSRESLHVFSQLDFNDDGIISYNDFLQTILPQEDNKLKNLATLRESYYIAPGKPLPYEVEWGITRIFEQEIKNFRNIENLRDILQSSIDFNTLDCFNAIDQDLLGFIDFQSINIFTRSCNKVLSDEEIYAFLRAIGGADTGKITFNQFAQAIQPDRPIAQRQNKPQSASRITRYLTPKKSNSDYLEYLSKSLERSRIIAEIESESKIAQIQRSLERSERIKSIEREELRRTLERQELRKQILEDERLGSLEKEIERSRILEKSRLLQQSRIIKDLEEKDRLDQIQRSIEREQKLRDLERSRIIQEIENQEIEMKLRSQSKLRELERSRIIQDLEEQQRINEFNRSRLQYESPNKNSYISPMRSTGFKSANKLSPMKGNEEEHLIRALKAQVEIDRDIEETKKQLALRPDFNLLDAFRIFDGKQRGYCTKLEFQVALNDIAIFPSSDEIYLYFKRLDKDQDGLLKYSEFCKAILPFSQEYLDLMNNRQPAYLNNLEGFNSFTQETRYIFKQLINKQINGEREAESIRQQFTRRPLFSIHDAFGAIDAEENGYITMDQFKRIFNDYGFFVNSTDLVSLVDRYDKNQDGKVSYGEFLSEMTPKSPQKYY